MGYLLTSLHTSLVSNTSYMLPKLTLRTPAWVPLAMGHFPPAACHLLSSAWGSPSRGVTANHLCSYLMTTSCWHRGAELTLVFIPTPALAQAQAFFLCPWSIHHGCCPPGAVPFDLATAFIQTLFSPYPCQALFLASLWVRPVLVTCETVSQCGFHLCLPDVQVLDSYFLSLLEFCVSSLVKWLFISQIFDF